MGASDDDVAPWLPAERALLVDAVERGVPVLGLCLGGQLLAVAMGGRVTLGPATEIGVVDVQRTVEGLVDPVLSQAVPAAGSDIPAPQWHQDNIIDLPDGAVLLLSNEACRVQGFRVGSTAYGLQLHPEVDADTFGSWADSADEALKRSGRDAQEATAEMHAAGPDLIAAWRPVARAWGDLVWERARNG
jgi:GMP synthase-like glutamine amidotransferase